jgi:hypothetical protein
MKTNELEIAAKKYSEERKVSIKLIKSLHGETQLYYAFIAGASWQKEQIALNVRRLLSDEINK